MSKNDDQSLSRSDDAKTASRRTFVAAAAVGLAGAAALGHAAAEEGKGPTVAGPVLSEQARFQVAVAGGPVFQATVGGEFRSALRAIASDDRYRKALLENPAKLLEDFKLSLQDLRALRNAAVLSGSENGLVDGLLSRSEIQPFAGRPVAADTGCCCCCCCGQAGSEVLYHA